MQFFLLRAKAPNFPTGKIGAKRKFDQFFGTTTTTGLAGCGAGATGGTYMGGCAIIGGCAITGCGIIGIGATGGYDGCTGG
ncbi:MAG: hypothetical protein K2H43_05970 [Clostridia bacterium]|nr:hypothetical protein [Clostridia bacterium]